MLPAPCPTALTHGYPSRSGRHLHHQTWLARRGRGPGSDPGCEAGWAEGALMRLIGWLAGPQAAAPWGIVAEVGLAELSQKQRLWRWFCLREACLNKTLNGIIPGPNQSGQPDRKTTWRGSQAPGIKSPSHPSVPAEMFLPRCWTGESRQLHCFSLSCHLAVVT